ncbi:MAG TPA: cytochrome c [Bryobacteraceae bacterium]|nr:cytochrome c [Bryobacteraceae bacterium]
MTEFRAPLLFFASAAALFAQTPARGRGASIVGRGYPDYDQAVVARGEKTFVATCGFCHGANAKGGESGPDLIRSTIVLDDDNGEKIGPVVLNGRGAMPKFSLTAAQISDIATFLHQRIKDAALRGTYTIQNIVDGDAAAGEAYFNGAGKCNACHSPAGDLKGIGAKYDPVTLQGKFLMPRGGRGAVDSPRSKVMVTVTLASGKRFTGELKHIDDFEVAMVDSEGDYHAFSRDGDVPKVEVHDPLQAHYDMLVKYSDRDMHNLTAYLVTLK